MECDAQARSDRETLWITDAELIRRLGAPEKIAREALRALDAAQSGFPKKQKLWGDRRYWPAVKAYFDASYGAARLIPENRIPHSAAATIPLRNAQRRRYGQSP
jgi:hypothetical protein